MNDLAYVIALSTTAVVCTFWFALYRHQARRFLSFAWAIFNVWAIALILIAAVAGLIELAALIIVVAAFWNAVLLIFDRALAMRLRS